MVLAKDCLNLKLKEDVDEYVSDLKQHSDSL